MKKTMRLKAKLRSLNSSYLNANLKVYIVSFETKFFPKQQQILLNWSRFNCVIILHATATVARCVLLMLQFHCEFQNQRQLVTPCCRRM